jgi:hypothetical protein
MSCQLLPPSRGRASAGVPRQSSRQAHVVLAVLLAAGGAAAWQGSAPRHAARADDALPAVEFRVQTLDGQQATGVVQALDAQQLTLQTADGSQQFAVASLLWLEAAARPTRPAFAPNAWVELLDGSRWPATNLTVKDGTLKCDYLMGQALSVSTRAVAYVRLKEQDERLAAQWAEVLQARAAGDLLVIRKGENIDYIEGVVKEISAEQVLFQLEGVPTPVQRDRVEGVVFFHASRPTLPDPVCVIDEASTARWSARAVTSQGAQVHIETQSGLRVATTWDALSRLDFSAGKLAYLSDLQPESVQWTPYLGPALPLDRRWAEPQRDRSAARTELRLGDKTYAKGLGLRSRTELAYRLRGKYSRLEAVVGIDDHVRNAGGNVQLVIRGDERVLLDEAIDAADPPRTIKLDIRGVSRLTILVDFGQNQGWGDHLDLCDIKVLQ